MPHSPPVPVSAHFDTGTKYLYVTFDRPLIWGDIQPLNWACTVSLIHRTGSAVAYARGTVASIKMANPFAGAGPDVCSYDPPPFDVLGRYDRTPAAAFADFPLT